MTTTCDGILDVSHWEMDDARRNGRTLVEELTQAKAAGIIAVILKATQGKDYMDPSLHPFISACKAINLLIGTYHFPSNSAPGNVQADWYLKVLKDAGLDIATTPLALDRETNDADPKTTQDIDDARLFVKRIFDTTGKYPMLYGNTSFLANIVDPKDILANCPLWIAVYGAASPHIPKAFKDYFAWQNTDGRFTSGGYPGYTPGFGHIDRSSFKGTAAELTALWPNIGRPVPELPQAA